MPNDSANSGANDGAEEVPVNHSPHPSPIAGPLRFGPNGQALYFVAPSILFQDVVVVLDLEPQLMLRLFLCEGE